MSSLLKKWLKRETLTVLSPAQQSIVMKLQDWLREHRMLRVSLLGDTQSYQSLVVALQPDRNCFVIDELFPRYQGSLALVGQTLKVALKDHGREVYLQCHCLAETMHQGLPAYALKIPQHLMQTQRRRGYRALVSGAMRQSEVVLRVVSASVDAHMPTLSGIVKDVSIWGVGLVVQGDWREKLMVSQHLGAQIMVEDLLQAEVFLEIKNIRYDSQTHLTTLGCVFVSIAQQLQAQLQRKITEIQRLHVRQLRDSQVV
jgi:hypothetical protein